MNTTSRFPTTIITTTISTTTTTKEVEQNGGVWLGIFIAILVCSMLALFLMIGACIIWHRFYMKVFKRDDK